jgi:hypothetical protein
VDDPEGVVERGYDRIVLAEDAVVALGPVATPRRDHNPEETG